MTVQLIRRFLYRSINFYYFNNDFIEIKEWEKSKSLLEKEYVPEWFMETANWWSKGKISDEDYNNMMEETEIEEPTEGDKPFV